MRRAALVLLALLSVVPLVLSGAAAQAVPKASLPAAPGRVVATVGARVIPALPGFRRTPSGPVLDVARFTSVAGLTLPASPAARTVVLRFEVRVDVPIRIALSVRAWCEVVRPLPAQPDGRSAADVLVIGQNPVPGRSAVQVASRTLSGRAVVDLPAGRTARCTAQLSPRTESTTGSSLRVLSGQFTAAPETVLARAAQRPAVLVGSAAAPGLPPGAGSAAARATRPVAVLAPVPVNGPVRLEGEAELTTCALGYHLCGRGTAPTSTVDVVLVLTDVDAAGRVCRTWRGSTRRAVITPAVHHVKLVVPALVPPTRCGVAVGGHLLVEYRGGNAVEVEPTLGLPGDVRRVQTHVWLARA